MKTASIMLFLIAIVGVFALVQLNSSQPSGQAVQPTQQSLGYCPVTQANQDCALGGRAGTCVCKTLDSHRPLYYMRENCECRIPIYGQYGW